MFDNILFYISPFLQAKTLISLGILKKN